MVNCISFDLGFKTFTYSIIEIVDRNVNIKTAEIIDITVNVNKK